MTVHAPTTIVTLALTPAELPEGKVVSMTAETLQIALIREGETVHAFIDECPHGAASFEGEQVRDGCVRCPLHGALFELASGAPRKGPARQALTRLTVQRATSGHLTVELPTD